MNNKNNGFTLIELIIVIVILGILAVVAAPKFIDVTSDAKIATLNALKGQFKSTISLVQAKARVKGLKPVATNPGGGNSQAGYLVDFGFGDVELDFRNLCPESSGELGDQLDMLDFLDISDDFKTVVTNQYTLIGYILPNGYTANSTGLPSTTQGCYLLYDSFGDPNCTVDIVIEDC